MEKNEEKMEKNLEFEEKGETSAEILLNFAVAFYKKSLELNSGCSGTWQALGLAYYFLAKLKPNESAVQFCIDSLMMSLKINAANVDCWKTVNHENFFVASKLRHGRGLKLGGQGLKQQQGINYCLLYTLRLSYQLARYTQACKSVGYWGLREVDPAPGIDTISYRRKAERKKFYWFAVIWGSFLDRWAGIRNWLNIVL